MTAIPQNFLFRLRFPVKRVSQDVLDAPIAPEALDSSYSVPFWSLYDLPDGFDKRSGEPGLLRAKNPKIENLFDFRLGWAKEGLFFTVAVDGKKTQPFWTHSELSSADCARLCIDARDVKDLRRGTKYCHKFLFYPFVGESANAAAPMAQWAPVNRAKASPRAVDVADFKIAARARKGGYVFSAFIPGSSITGYDVDEFNRLGLHYVVRDSQYGAFVLQHADPVPCEDDPSLWASFVLEE